MYEWPFDPETESATDRERTLFKGRSLPTGLKDRLQQDLGADLILPTDSKYDGERGVFNQAFDPFPAAIAICSNEDQIRLCLQGARDFGFPFCIRGSGHSFAGYSSMDDVLLIDMRKISDVQIDAASKVVSVGAGCKLGELDKQLKANALRLNLGSGVLSVGGFMQGGGYGLFPRTLGMNCDAVTEVRVMLADGTVVTANENKNHDLWWAMRGGTGGNFGILLSATYLARERLGLTGRRTSWNLTDRVGPANAAKALNIMQDILDKAPPELSLQADIRYYPDDPDDLSRTPWLDINANYFGSEANLATVLAPLSGTGESIRTQVGLNHPINYPFVRHSCFISELPLTEWRSLIDDFLDNSNRLSTLTFDAMGGAVNAYPVEDSSFVHRGARFNSYVTGFWIKGDRADYQKVNSYIHGWNRIIKPFWNRGVYQNFPYAEVPDFRINYWGKAFPALFGVKRKYDPSGAFAFPQAIDAVSTIPGNPVWPPCVVEALSKAIER
jgi:FAD binding domain/Berberine and berberine like